jgi:hypothetical protein
MTDAPVTTGPIPHGVVFIYDPKAIIDVPEDTSAGPVLSTKNCVSIWTIGEYEGEVEISFADEIGDATCSLVFRGQLETPNKAIAFNNSSCEPLTEISLETVNTAVSIYTNDPRDPTKVVCVVTA